MVTVEAVGQIGTTVEDVEGMENGWYSTVEGVENMEALRDRSGNHGRRSPWPRAQPARPPAARGGVGRPATSRRALAHEAVRRGSGDTAVATVTVPADQSCGLRNSLHVSTTSTVPWSAQTRT